MKNTLTHSQVFPERTVAQQLLCDITPCNSEFCIYHLLQNMGYEEEKKERKEKKKAKKWGRPPFWCYKLKRHGS